MSIDCVLLTNTPDGGAKTRASSGTLSKSVGASPNGGFSQHYVSAQVGLHVQGLPG
jgi:hypothetical protein